MKNRSWEAETQGEKQTIHSKKKPTGGGAPKGIKQASREQSPPNVNCKREASQTTEEGDSEEEAKVKEAEAAENKGTIREDQINYLGHYTT